MTAQQPDAARGLDVWRIYYERDTRDDLTRPYGVVCISQSDDFVGHKVITGYDYYLLIDGLWLGMFYDGMMHYLTEHLSRVSAVTVGAMVQSDTFERVYKQAKNDPDFVKKTAAYRMDRPNRGKGRVDA